MKLNLYNRLNKLSRKSGGFTLIEIMIVVVILGVLATLVLPNFIGKDDQARQTRAQSDIRSISSAIELYKLEKFKYPNTLDEVINSGLLKKMPEDPWNRPYQYKSGGANYKLFSYGADGSEGGEGYNADITNE